MSRSAQTRPIDPARLDALDRAIAADEVLRGEWTDGHGRACALAHLAPETGERRTSEACPATVMPQWLAALTPEIDDHTSLAARPAILRRYAAVARRWHALDAPTWRRLDFETRALSVRVARPHATAAEWRAIDAVLALLDQEAAGKRVPAAAWDAASAAAWDAAGASAWDAARAAAWDAARDAAGAAARAAASAAARAAISTGLLSAIERECTRAEAA